MKKTNIIIQAIAGFIRSIRTTSRAKYIDELEKKHNFIIDFNTLKTYEGTPCYSSSVILQCKINLSKARR